MVYFWIVRHNLIEGAGFPPACFLVLCEKIPVQFNYKKSEMLPEHTFYSLARTETKTSSSVGSAI